MTDSDIYLPPASSNESCDTSYSSSKEDGSALRRRTACIKRRFRRRLTDSIKPFIYQIRILHFLSTVLAFDWSFRNFFYKKADKNSLKAKGLAVILFQTCIKGNLLFRNHKWNLNPSTPKISLVILVTNCHIVLMMRVWRIWYWINW